MTPTAFSVCLASCRHSRVVLHCIWPHQSARMYIYVCVCVIVCVCYTYEAKKKGEKYAVFYFPKKRFFLYL